jgi:DNA-binding IclR family transcriptional regulator
MVEEITGRRLKTTQTSLEILRLILEHDGLALAELDSLVDASKSSICSHLNTLRENRYLIEEDGTFEVSFRVALLGERVRHRYPSEDVVEEVVDRLARETGQEANFTLFEHGRLLVFYGTSGSAAADDVHYRSEYYLHNTASGKAILAELDRERVEAILNKWGLPRESEATITSRDQLFDELDRIAAQGYATVDEEFAPGLVAVGAPVHDADGDVVGGLSLGGPKYRIDMTYIDHEFADRLLDAVDSLESSLAA